KLIISVFPKTAKSGPIAVQAPCHPAALMDGTAQSARVARMAQASPSSSRPSGAVATFGPLPGVRLELRHGSARPLVYEVSDLGFPSGSVPGCDLRVPGVDLPPVLCLIPRHTGGATLRKLVPAQMILVNGRPLANGPLVHGDRVSVGPVELLVHVTPST